MSAAASWRNSSCAGSPISAALAEADILDPLGRPDKFFVQCRDRIAEALEGVVKKLGPPEQVGNAGVQLLYCWNP